MSTRLLESFPPLFLFIVLAFNCCKKVGHFISFSNFGGFFRIGAFKKKWKFQLFSGIFSLQFWWSKTFPGFMWGSTQHLGPISLAVLAFIGYKQTDRQAKFLNNDIIFVTRQELNSLMTFQTENSASRSRERKEVIRFPPFLQPKTQTKVKKQNIFGIQSTDCLRWIGLQGSEG